MDGLAETIPYASRILEGWVRGRTVLNVNAWLFLVTAVGESGVHSYWLGMPKTASPAAAPR